MLHSRIFNNSSRCREIATALTIGQSEASCQVEKLTMCSTGPNTLVGLAKREGVSRTDLVKRLLPAYSQVLKELKSLGVPEVQIHEPILTVADAADLESDFKLTFAEFEKSGLYINLVTYYDDIGDAYPWTIK